MSLSSTGVSTHHIVFHIQKNYASQRLCFDCILPEVKKCFRNYSSCNDPVTQDTCNAAIVSCLNRTVARGAQNQPTTLNQQATTSTTTFEETATFNILKILISKSSKGVLSKIIFLNVKTLAEP